MIRPTTETSAITPATADRRVEQESKQVRPLFSSRVPTEPAAVDGSAVAVPAPPPAVPFHETLRESQERHAASPVTQPSPPVSPRPHDGAVSDPTASQVSASARRMVAQQAYTRERTHTEAEHPGELLNTRV